MAGEAEPLAPAALDAGAPQEAAAVASPAAAAPATPEIAPAAVEPAPAAVVEPAAPAAPVSEPTLLQKFDAEQAAAAKPSEPAKPAEPAAAAVEAKPAEPAKPAVEAAKPADAPKPDVAAAAVAPVEPVAPVAPEPVAYEYALPETIRMDDATKGSFHTALDSFRADPAKGAQGLIDLHNQTMQQYADGLADEQRRVWNETRKGWNVQVMADEELGGSGHQTTMGAVARMRDLLVPEAHRPAFEEFLTTTGAGDHPEFLRLLHNAARLYDEAPMPPPGARPPADNGKPPGRGLRSLYKSNQRTAQ